MLVLYMTPRQIGKEKQASGHAQEVLKLAHSVSKN